MELMMSHLHAGPAVAARGADATEVTFLVRFGLSRRWPRRADRDPAVRDD